MFSWLEMLCVVFLNLTSFHRVVVYSEKKREDFKNHLIYNQCTPQGLPSDISTIFTSEPTPIHQSIPQCSLFTSSFQQQT